MIRLLLVFLFMYSCAGPGTYQIVYESLRSQLPGEKLVPVSQEFYDSQKFSFAVLKLGKKDPIILVLASFKDGVFQWVSKDKVSIFTDRNGVIIKTRGLINDVYIPNFNVDSTLISNFTNSSYFTNYYQPELLNILTFYNINYSEDSLFEYLQGVQVESLTVESDINLPTIRFLSKKIVVINKARGEMMYTKQKIHPHLPYLEIRYYLKR